MQRNDNEDPRDEGSRFLKNRDYKGALNFYLNAAESHTFTYRMQVIQAYSELAEFAKAAEALYSLQKDYQDSKDLEEQYLLWRSAFNFYIKKYYYKHEKASDRDEKLLDKAKESLEKLPQNYRVPSVTSFWIRYYHAIRDYDTALNLIEKFQTHSHHFHGLKVSVQKIKIQIYAELNYTEQAMESAAELVKIATTENYGPHSVLSAMKTISKSVPEVMNSLDYVLPDAEEINTNTQSQVRLALLLEKQPGNAESVIELYEKVIAKKEFRWSANLNLAYYLQKRKNDFRGSLVPLLDMLEQANQCPPHKKPTQDQLLKAYTSLAIAYLNLNDKDNFHQCLQSGFAINPNHAPLHAVRIKSLNTRRRVAKEYEINRHRDTDRFDRNHEMPTPQPSLFSVVDFPPLPSSRAAKTDKTLRVNIPLSQSAATNLNVNPTQQPVIITPEKLQTSLPEIPVGKLSEPEATPVQEEVAAIPSVENAEKVAANSQPRLELVTETKLPIEKQTTSPVEKAEEIKTAKRKNSDKRSKRRQEAQHTSEQQTAAPTVVKKSSCSYTCLGLFAATLTIAGTAMVAATAAYAKR